MLPLKLSPWAKHKQKWSTCTRCSLHENRHNVVLCRGQLPCDVLMCGEAPGFSEDANGIPFVPGAPAGSLLEHIVAEAFADHPKLRIAYTNVVGCLPLDEEGTKNSTPPKECIDACLPRVMELITIGKPWIIVTVGALAKKHVVVDCLGGWPLVINIDHPAYIIRLPSYEQTSLVSRAIVTIQDALDTLTQIHSP